MAQCKAVLKFGDDHGDNQCTIHCQLEEGHEGKHREIGKLRNAFPYVVEWPKDMRSQCVICKRPIADEDVWCCSGCCDDVCIDCIAIREGTDRWDPCYCTQCITTAKCTDCGKPTHLQCPVCGKPTCAACMKYWYDLTLDTDNLKVNVNAYRDLCQTCLQKEEREQDNAHSDQGHREGRDGTK